MGYERNNQNRAESMPERAQATPPARPLLQQQQQPQQNTSTIEYLTTLGSLARALAERLELLGEQITLGPSIGNGKPNLISEPQPAGLNSQLSTALDAINTAHSHLSSISRYLGFEVS